MLSYILDNLFVEFFPQSGNTCTARTVLWEAGKIKSTPSDYFTIYAIIFPLFWRSVYTELRNSPQQSMHLHDMEENVK